MERSLTNELYSEVLEPKLELGQTSVPDIKQSHSLTSPCPIYCVILDGEDDQWCEDGLSWNGSDGELDETSDLNREWQTRRNQFHTIGYRDGLITGKEASAQEGFNVGFKESVAVGFNWGLVRGVTGALACLPGEIREKIIESQETRSKFHDLYESANNLSTTDALKLFHDDHSNKMVKQRDNGQQGSEVSVLDSYYGELQSLIVESPAIKVQSEMKQ